MKLVSAILLLPSFISNYVGYATKRNPKHACESFESVTRSKVKPAYLSNLLLGKFGHSICFSLTTLPMAIASFIDRIFYVLGVSPKPKMGWIYTCPIITSGAVVQNMHSIWNRPKMNYPTRPMSQSCTHTVSPCDVSVPSFSNIGSPYPTAISNLNAVKKTSYEVMGNTLSCEEFWRYVSLHNQALFGYCRAPGGVIHAGAFI